MDAETIMGYNNGKPRKIDVLRCQREHGRRCNEAWKVLGIWLDGWTPSRTASRSRNYWEANARDVPIGKKIDIFHSVQERNMRMAERILKKTIEHIKFKARKTRVPLPWLWQWVYNQGWARAFALMATRWFGWKRRVRGATEVTIRNEWLGVTPDKSPQSQKLTAVGCWRWFG